jgi:hypothetical protein
MDSSLTSGTQYIQMYPFVLCKRNFLSCYFISHINVLSKLTAVQTTHGTGRSIFSCVTLNIYAMQKPVVQN